MIAFPYGYVCLHFLTDYDKSPSMSCTFMMKNECWASFKVVEGETDTTAYDLQMYGKLDTSIDD